MKLTWHLKRFSELSLKTFWQIAYLRNQVFEVEQDSPYQEIDKQDLHSYHVYAKDADNHLVAYARFFKTKQGYSFGRVVIPKTMRGKGLGKVLIQHILKDMNKIYSHVKIVIEAQYYAIGFYKKCGFYTVGTPFRDAGRKHIKMVRD